MRGLIRGELLACGQEGFTPLLWADCLQSAVMVEKMSEGAKAFVNVNNSFSGFENELFTFMKGGLVKFSLRIELYEIAAFDMFSTRPKGNGVNFAKQKRGKHPPNSVPLAAHSVGAALAALFPALHALTDAREAREPSRAQGYFSTNEKWQIIVDRLGRLCYIIPRAQALGIRPMVACRIR